MFWGILIGGILLVLVICGVVAAFKDGEYGSGFFFMFLGVLPGMVVWLCASAAINGNQSEAEWKFPADTYTLTMEVTVTEQEAIINGEKAVLINRDTTYIIKGIQPTIGDTPYEQHSRELKKNEIQ